MRAKYLPVFLPAHSTVFCLLASTVFAYAQTQSAQRSSPDFNVGPAKDGAAGVIPSTKNLVSGQSQVNSPNRTVGTQQDGSIVVSDNQTLTPAGKIIELGAPVRAKAIALNPNRATHSAAVLLMGSPQPVIVFDTVTGQVLQRFLPSDATGSSPRGMNAGSFTGIT
jgi:hypothetical protein